MRNLKKVIALIAVFAMMVSTVAFAATFGDVKEGDNYYEAIETLNKLGILTGDDENNDGVMEYRPNDSITRAEITVIVARIQGQTGAVAQADITLPVKVISIESGNSKTVSYDSATGFLTWNNTDSCALVLL